MSEAILSSPGYRPRQHGGYPRVGSSSLYFADGSKMPGARIDGRVRASRMMGGGDQGPIATRGLTMRGGPTPLEQAATRQQNIATSRADGTFDAKRNAFNAANKGSWMDEQGNIGPKAPLPTGDPAKERVPVVNPSPMSKPAAPAGPPAPRPPATFEGKSRAEWFGSAAKRQGVNNAYSGDAVAEAQKASTKPAAPASPTVAAKPTPTPAVPTAKTATAMPSLGYSPEAIDKAIADAGKQTGVQPRTMAGPAAPAPAAKPTTPIASAWAKSGASTAQQAAGAADDAFNAKFKAQQADRAAKEQRIADLEQQAKPGAQRVGEAAMQGAKFIGGNVRAAAQSVNEGVPKLISGAATGAENVMKDAVAKAKEVTAPLSKLVHGDPAAGAEAARLKAELNPPAKKAYVPTYTGGDNPPVPRSAQEDDKNKPGRLFTQNRSR